ncbi:hypothetical protein OG689_41015 [Kitasatospora sp. NBC_00240]|uniref:hypothetical protein n=1 Tax=Kitasatospora sp. NBC_00240 TaxID=2903567 RepID=UPI0022544FCC|nr:hypothetical protein [Kitasatospora sp. NBC_00240]MCX5215545.1 hypothetical protein [Kitasatospora sp. NBC_00240]
MHTTPDAFAMSIAATRATAPSAWSSLVSSTVILPRTHWNGGRPGSQRETEKLNGVLKADSA